MRPVNRRHINFTPFSEVATEGFGVLTFLNIIHFFKDDGSEFAQNAFPIYSANNLWKAHHKLRNLAQNGDVKIDGFLKVGPLNFDRDGFAGMQSSPIHLTKRSGSNRFGSD